VRLPGAVGRPEPGHTASLDEGELFTGDQLRDGAR
jgi:hypothetical protein